MNSKALFEKVINACISLFRNQKEIFGVNLCKKIPPILVFLVLLQGSVFAYNYITVSQWSPTSIDKGCPNTTFTAKFTVKNISSGSINVIIPNWDETYITSISPRTITLASQNSSDFTVTGTVPASSNLPYSFLIDIVVQVQGTTVENASTNFFYLTSRYNPLAPYNLTASNITSNGCSLSWSSSNALYDDGYRVYSGSTVVGTSTYRSVTLTSLSSATNYTLFVRAYNNCSESANSNTVSILTKPSTPTNFTYTNLTQTSFTLTWNACSGIVTGYKLYDENDNLLYTLSATSKSISGLCPSVTKKYKLCAYNSSGESAKTSVLSVTTPYLATITGTIPICTTGTFTINNMPSGYSVSVWTPSSNLIFQSSSGNSATYLSNGIAEASVSATITSATCPSKNFTFNTWLGVPQLRNKMVDGLAYTPGMLICPGNHYLTITPVGGTTTNSAWTVPSGVPYFVGTNMLDFTFPNSMSSIAITATSSNTCGTSTNYSFYLSKKTYGCTTGFATMAYPNPVSDNLTISMSDKNNFNNDIIAEKSATKDNLGENSYTVRIVDSQNRIVKTFKFTGSETSISVNDIKNGQYLVEVSDGRNKYTQKLVVFHR